MLQTWLAYLTVSHDHIVSGEVVAEFNYIFRGQESHEATFAEEMENCRAVKDRVSMAQQIAPVKATKDYTYRTSQAAGDGWVLVRDAFGFLDTLDGSFAQFLHKSVCLTFRELICNATASEEA